MVSTKKTIKKPVKQETKTLTLNNKKPTNNEKKGLLNFLFSFNGHISKELFLGSTFILLFISFLLDLAYNIITYYTMPTMAGEIIYNVFMLIILLMVISIGYKRAHSLGISGFYSLVGTLIFKPYFALYTPKTDMAKDEEYKSKFERTKKIGYFFNKSIGKQILYITIIGIVSIVSYTSTYMFNDTTKESMKYVLSFVTGLAGFNLIQVLILNSKFVEKYYTPIVKIVSFFGYTALVVLSTIVVYTTYIFLALVQAMSTMPQ